MTVEIELTGSFSPSDRERQRPSKFGRHKEILRNTFAAANRLEAGVRAPSAYQLSVHSPRFWEDCDKLMGRTVDCVAPKTTSCNLVNIVLLCAAHGHYLKCNLAGPVESRNGRRGTRSSVQTAARGNRLAAPATFRNGSVVRLLYEQACGRRLVSLLVHPVKRLDIGNRHP
jgi:hypothetical protein